MNPGETITWPFSPDRVAYAGDMHGNRWAMRRAIQHAADNDTRLIVQLGDFGIWPGTDGQKYLREVTRTAERYDVTVAFIDGNHEDFPQLHAHPVSDDGLRWVTDRIAHIPRGSRWEWHGQRYAALGGAVSVDKASRKEGKTWWPEEAISATDITTLTGGGPCDILLTHDAPTGVDIPGIEHRTYPDRPPTWLDPADLEAAWDHRDLLLDAVRAVQPTTLWHGHYHQRHSTTVRLPGMVHPLKVEGLSWDGDRLRAHVHLEQLTG